ncbi:Rpn family recombination-promoting nuclease/putative transposase [Limosilactobacillus oris]|uniref:Rpn family recombination-promoting nuclease/putative transposase n=1 Tax=Limosilactobacillus oris TaxID=1632 RepID=UPI0021B47FD0|nr:Rpn family recombination-promoting nuclease/putative transposase [Limosilactobacillus oris]UXC67176.1 Rpn family recombination-promoting nuclease/putative transposase [Limosilactobacillus oris]
MNREHELTRLAQQWEELTIANDRMFSMVMENNAICRELLRRIFPELAIDRVQRVTVQKQVNTPLDARTVRFDVYIRDDQQRTYIMEMQVANRQNLPYRLRYYLEQVDHSILGPGDNYEKLAGYPTYVVFFCDFDYYGQDRSEYRFEWRNIDEPDLVAGTGQQLVVFNAQASTFHDSIGVAGFLKLMHNQIAVGDPLVEQVIQEMERIKQDPERRRDYMKYELDLMDARSDGMAIGLAEGKKQGLEQGKQESIVAAAKMLLGLELSRTVIVKQLMSAYDLSSAEAERYLKRAQE